MEFTPRVAPAVLDTHLGPGLAKKTAITLHASLAGFKIGAPPAQPTFVKEIGVADIQAVQCNRKKKALRITTRGELHQHIPKVVLILTAPDGVSPADRESHVDAELSALFLIGKRGVAINRVFPNLADAERLLETTPGMADVREDFCRLKPLVKAEEFWARRIDTLKALHKRAAAARAHAGAKSGYAARYKKLAEDPDLHAAYQLLVPRPLGDDAFWRRVAELERKLAGPDTAEGASIAKKIVEESSIGVERLRELRQRRAGQLADHGALTVDATSSLPSLLGGGDGSHGGGAFGIVNRDARSAAHARLPPPDGRTLRDEAGREVDLRTYAEQAKQALVHRDEELNALNRLSAAELDALGRGPEGEGEGGAQVAAGAADPLRRQASVDDAFAAAREHAMAQGGMAEEDEDEERDGPGPLGGGTAQGGRKRGRYVTLSARGVDGVTRAMSGGAPEASHGADDSVAAADYAALKEGFAACLANAARQMQREREAPSEVNTLTSKFGRVDGLSSSSRVATDAMRETLRREVAKATEALRNGWACWADAPHDADSARAVRVIAARLKTYKVSLDLLINKKRGGLAFDSQEKEWQALKRQVTAFEGAEAALVGADQRRGAAGRTA